jgi:tetratricopeptide (TPR) repeat protein
VAPRKGPRRSAGPRQLEGTHALSPDGRRALLGDSDNHIRLWDLEKGTEIHRLEGHEKPVQAVAFSADGRRGLSGGTDGTVILWDLDQGRRMRRFRASQGIRAVCFASDGRCLLCADGMGNLIRWDCQSGEERWRFAVTAYGVAAAFSPDGRRAVTTQSRFVRLWDMSEQAAGVAAAVRLARQGNVDGAVAAFTRLIERRPKEPGWLLARARLYARKGQWDRAVADYTKAFGPDGADADLLPERGRCFAVLGQWDKAAADFAKALAQYPEGQPTQAGQAQLCAELLAWDDVFARVTVLRPGDWLLWITRAREHVRWRRWDKAAADYARGTANRPVQTDSFEYAAVLLLQGDAKGYRRFCGQLVKRAGPKPDPATAYLLARTCALGEGAGVDAAAVVRWAEQAVAGGKASTDRLHARGLAHYRAGQYDQAIKRINEAAQYSYRPYLDWFVLAMAHHRKGEAAEARQWLAKGVAYLDKLAPPTADRPVSLPAIYWLEAQVLRREAEALLKAKKPVVEK